MASIGLGFHRGANSNKYLDQPDIRVGEFFVNINDFVSDRLYYIDAMSNIHQGNNFEFTWLYSGPNPEIDHLHVVVQTE